MNHELSSKTLMIEFNVNKSMITVAVGRKSSFSLPKYLLIEIYNNFPLRYLCDLH